MQLVNPWMQCSCLLGAAPALGGSAHTAGQGYGAGAGVAWEQRPKQESPSGFGFLKARGGGGHGREVGRRTAVR